MASHLAENAKSARTLVSWKEIAAFLNRGERTAKRWERERGLPVHRVPGGERGSVFAYPDELADWLKGKSTELEADDAAPGNRSSDSGDVQLTGTQNANGSSTQHSSARAELSPSLQPAGGRRQVSSARIAAWLVPLALTASLIFYFSINHMDTRVTAVGDREPANPAAPGLAPDAVAVLPFTNAGGNAGSDYLSDGITESLIDNLARIPQLKIRSRDSVFRLKGKDIEIKDAGNELGVAMVVSGRVSVTADNIQVSAELTDVRDNTEIWGKQYAARKSGLLQLQQQIAGDLAGQLRSALSPADKAQITRQGTQNPEAYNLYLKGRYGWNHRNRPSLDASIPYFNQAIARDPGYALAYSALADVYSALPYFGGNPAEDFPKSSIAAREALRLDPTLAHPHAILASIQMSYEWDFAGGEAEFRKALALDPNDATAHQWLAENLGTIGGREKEALSEIDRAHLLDPTSPVILRVKGSVYVAARRYDDAIAVCRQLLVQNPSYNVAHDCLAYAYWGKRMYPEVIEQWAAYSHRAGDAEFAVFGDALERGYHSGGWRAALTEGITARINQHHNGYGSAYEIGRLYADLGDKEKAFEWLDTAYREHDFLLRELNTAFEVDNLRSDPRFAELVRKVGLPKIQ